MATTISFAAANQPRSVADVSCIEAVQGSGTTTYATGTSAAGAVHFTNLKIPHGATITDVVVYHRQLGSTAGFGHNVGIDGGITSSALFGSESFSSTTRAVSMAQSPTGGTFPYKVSVSDDAAKRYVYPTVTTVATGTGSISVSVTVLVRWSMNKSNAAAQ